MHIYIIDFHILNTWNPHNFQHIPIFYWQGNRHRCNSPISPKLWYVVVLPKTFNTYIFKCTHNISPFKGWKPPPKFTLKNDFFKDFSSTTSYFLTKLNGKNFLLRNCFTSNNVITGVASPIFLRLKMHFFWVFFVWNSKWH